VSKQRWRGGVVFEEKVGFTTCMQSAADLIERLDGRVNMKERSPMITMFSFWDGESTVDSLIASRRP
jgi:hypothetical protein